MMLLCDSLIRAYEKGFQYIEAAQTGRKRVVFEESYWKNRKVLNISLNACERVSHFVAGCFLCIPVINCVVLAILQKMPCFQDVFIVPEDKEIAPLTHTIGSGFAHLEEEAPTGEICKRRKTQFIDKLQKVKRELIQEEQPEKAWTQYLNRFRIAPHLLQFRLYHFTCDLTAKSCNGMQKFFDHANTDPQLQRQYRRLKGQEGILIWPMYQAEESLTSQQIESKRLLGKLVDFFERKFKNTIPGSEEDVRLQQTCNHVIQRIIDMHKDCADQVNAQLAVIFADLYLEKNTAENLRLALHQFTAVYLERYKIALLQEKVALENRPTVLSDETVARAYLSHGDAASDQLAEIQSKLFEHNADLFMLALKAEQVFSEEAQFSNISADVKDRLPRVLTAFQEKTKEGLNEPYLKYLIQSYGESTAYGRNSKMRSHLLNNAVSYFGYGRYLSSQDALDDRFDEALTKENEGDKLALLDGHPFNDLATVLLLEEFGIIELIQ